MEPIEKVKQALTKPLLEAGYELASASLTREKDGLTLHIMVDRDSPISMDDIVTVSGLVNPILDKEDPIPGPYTLDVSSLGAEKPLHLERLSHYLGQYVSLHLSNPYMGMNRLEGTIVEVTEDSLILSYKDKTREKKASLLRKDIDKANLAIKF